MTGSSSSRRRAAPRQASVDRPRAYERRVSRLRDRPSGSRLAGATEAAGLDRRWASLVIVGRLLSSGNGEPRHRRQERRAGSSGFPTPRPEHEAETGRVEVLGRHGARGEEGSGEPTLLLLLLLLLHGNPTPWFLSRSVIPHLALLDRSLLQTSPAWATPASGRVAEPVRTGSSCPRRDGLLEVRCPVAHRPTPELSPPAASRPRSTATSAAETVSAAKLVSPASGPDASIRKPSETRTTAITRYPTR